MEIGDLVGILRCTIKIPPVYDRNRWISSRCDTMVYGCPLWIDKDGTKWRMEDNDGSRDAHRLKGSTKGSKCAKIELMIRINDLFM